MKKRLVWAVVSVVIVAIIAGWFISRRGGDVQLASRSETSVARSLIAGEQFYLQADPRWARETVGGSEEPLAAVGCTLCCVSNALACHGLNIDPSELNSLLKKGGGYTERGWIKWDALSNLCKGVARITVPRNPSSLGIETSLRKGDPVLVKILLKSGVNHWVLLVGRDGRDYLMKDPLRSDREIMPLSTYESDIYAVRIVERIER